MTKLIFRVAVTAAVLAVVFACAGAAWAQAGQPDFFRALADLRHARAYMENAPGNGAMHEEERQAIYEIDQAVNEIKRAGIDDGKDIHDHPPIDPRMDWPGRLERTRSVLDAAEHDVARGVAADRTLEKLRDHVMEHTSKARHHVNELVKMSR
jgi:hypothetical protein